MAKAVLIELNRGEKRVERVTWLLEIAEDEVVQLDGGNGGHAWEEAEFGSDCGRQTNEFLQIHEWERERGKRERELNRRWNRDSNLNQSRRKWFMFNPLIIRAPSPDPTYGSGSYHPEKDTWAHIVFTFSQGDIWVNLLNFYKYIEKKMSNLFFL